MWLLTFWGWLTMLRNARLGAINKTVCDSVQEILLLSPEAVKQCVSLWSLTFPPLPPYSPIFGKQKGNLRNQPYSDFLLWESCLGLLAFFSLTLCLEEAFFWQFFDTEVPVLQDFEAGTRPCAATIGTNRGRRA